MVSIISIVVIFLKMCGIYATPCLTKSDQVLRPYSPHSDLSGPSGILWTSLNALKPLSLFERLDGHWTSLKVIEACVPLNPLTRSARSCLSNSPLRVTVFSGLPNIPLTALQYHCVLGNRTSVIESTDRGSPSCVFTNIYSFGQCVNQKWGHFLPTQHIVVATVTHERHRSHGQD